MDQDKVTAPAPDVYDPQTKIIDRRNTSAPQLDKQTDDRFKMNKDQLNAPAPDIYDPSTKMIDRRDTAAP